MATREIVNIKVVYILDENPDTSFLGEYTDEYDPCYFDREEGKMLRTLERDKEYEMPSVGREFRFFKPYAGGEEPGTPRYVRYGKQDLARMEGLNRGLWHFLGIRADAVVKLGNGDLCQKITSGGLWGVESDADDHLKEIEDDELSALRRELTAAGFSEEQIDAVEVDGREG